MKPNKEFIVTYPRRQGRPAHLRNLPKPDRKLVYCGDVKKLEKQAEIVQNMILEDMLPWFGANIEPLRTESPCVSWSLSTKLNNV